MHVHIIHCTGRLTNDVQYLVRQSSHSAAKLTNNVQDHCRQEFTFHSQIDKYQAIYGPQYTALWQVNKQTFYCRYTVHRSTATYLDTIQR